MTANIGRESAGAGLGCQEWLLRVTHPGECWPAGVWFWPSTRSLGLAEHSHEAGLALLLHSSLHSSSPLLLVLPLPRTSFLPPTPGVLPLDPLGSLAGLHTPSMGF